MIIIFTLILPLVLSESFLYESGTGITLTEPLKGIVDLNIKFTKEFPTTPKIAISIGELEMSGNNLMSEVLNASPQGFTIRVESDNLAQISYNWMATNNPLVHVEYVKSNQQDLKIPILNWETQIKPLLISYVIGFEFTDSDNKEITQEIQEIQQDQALIKVLGSKQYKICLLFSQFENSYATSDLGLIVIDDTHPWVSKEKQENTIMLTQFELPNDLQDYVNLIGITGFNSLTQEIKVEIEEKPLENNEIQVQFGTWDDSKLQGLSFMGMYFGNGKVQYFDENCAQLYSECNFQGNMVKICKSSEKIQYKGQVKSIHLPKGAIFTLFSKGGYEGQRQRFEKSEECFDALFIGR